MTHRSRSLPSRAAAALVLGIWAAAPLPAEPAPRKVVFLAGPITGHPKATHEYEKAAVLVKRLLESSPNLRGLRVEVHFQGWPEDPRTFDDAASIVFISDGCDRRESDHPLYAGERFAVIERQMARGCGLAMLHWSTFHPARVHERITEWVGGYFDYETGPPPRRWRSKIETKEWTASPASPEHPICRGVRPFKALEEFYFDIRFRDDDPRLAPILTIGPEEKREMTVAWAVERAGGGRGFGFTGGHFFDNWWQPDFRRLALNAIAWSAGLEVPPGGVDSPPLDPFRALIVTGYNHPAHEWRSTTAALFAALEQDPRARVEVTEDVEDLSRAPLEQYRLLVMNYCNWDRPGLSDAGKARLVKYLQGGGGLAVIHFANGAFNATLPAKDSDWEEYRSAIVRRVWMHGDGGSGHDPYGPFRVEIAAAEHPVTAGLGAFEVEDELYFRQRGELPITVVATARSKVTGNDEPMAWVHDYGRGRVFQTVLGHAACSIHLAAPLIRRGCVWAAGQEPLGFDPPAAHLEKTLFREGSPWTPEASKARAEKRAAAPPRPAPPAGSRVRPEGVLPPSPGIDGGVGGHWGLRGDDDWADARFQRMVVGPTFASSLATPGGVVAKALSLRLGDDDAAAACFDTGNLSARAFWRDGFVAVSEKRFGLIEMPRIGGTALFWSRGEKAWGHERGRFRGHFLSRGRAVLAYQVDGLEVLEAPWAERRGETRALARSFELGPSAAAHRLAVFETAAGAARLLETDGLRLAVVEDAGAVAAAALLGDSRRARLEAGAAGIALTLAPGRAAARVKVLAWRGPAGGIDEFRALARDSPPPDDVLAVSAPGPPRFAALSTRGERGPARGAFAIDTLSIPFENPWNALLYLSGLDFFSNGDAAVCSVHGDVWTVAGIDDGIERLTWRRFATGLYQPLGLRIAGDRVHVAGRDQITILHDRNGDGEADFYECFTNALPTAIGGHDYTCGLETDDAGNFYTASPAGLHRIGAGGGSHEVIASGWRNPYGIGVGPGGVITVAPQEGEWTPASAICEVRPGGYYGYGGPRPAPERPLGYDLPLVWIPRHIDNSSGGQVWVPRGRWGPLEGQLLGLSYGRSAFALVLRDVVGGQPQGAVAPLGGRFLSGVARGRFREPDGQLYVVGQNGWVTNAVQDGCFQRVRFTGGKVRAPIGWRAHADGIRLAFAEPLAAEAAEDAGNYSVERWNYRYSEAYGSEEYSVAHPDAVGHDAAALRGARLLESGREVFLAVADMAPAMQMRIRYSIAAADGDAFEGELYPTVHRLAPALGLDGFEDGEEAPAPAGEPGLELSLSRVDDGAVDARIARLAALRVESGESPSPFLEPGAFEALWEGSIVIDSGRSLRFSAAGRGRLRVEVGGEAVLEAEGDDLALVEGAERRLRRGAHRFRMQYRSPPAGDAVVRLYWSGRDFFRETVPATAFRRPPGGAAAARGERRRRGRELFAARRCARCHRPADEALVERGMPELAADAPSFDGIGGRLHQSWMAAWLRAPRRAMPPASMPDLLAGPDRDRQADDIAAYLATLSGDEAGAGASADAGSAEEGARRFRDLGCEACHAAPEDELGESAPPGQISLAGAGEKWMPAALAAFLEEPSRHYRAIRMPDFGLSGGEARSLAAYLLGRSPRPAAPAAARGDAARGRERVESLGCLACHELSGAVERRRMPGLESLAAVDWKARGCVADLPERRPLELGLDDEERGALFEFKAAGLASLGRADHAEFAARQLRALRCGACHERDGAPSAWSGWLTESAPADAGPSAPAAPARFDLTHAGDQFEADWLKRLLAGEIDERVRPYLKARMPAFPAAAAALARGLALEHGQSPAREPEAAPSEASRRIGARLLGIDGGFGCVSCHAVGARSARLQLHFGVTNLARARERLRPEFYLRWMYNPQRLDPRTPMPAYAEEDGRSALQAIYGGDARRQFEAVWAALGALVPSAGE
jgi:type 1 glutamine amidotransferase/cytochrome c2